MQAKRLEKSRLFFAPVSDFSLVDALQRETLRAENPKHPIFEKYFGNFVQPALCLTARFRGVAKSDSNARAMSTDYVNGLCQMANTRAFAVSLVMDGLAIIASRYQFRFCVIREIRAKNLATRSESLRQLD